MYDVAEIIARQARMEQARSNFEALWQETAELLLPRQADFIGSAFATTQGMRRTDRIFDETAMLALDHGCAVFEGEVIPQGGQWQRLQARDPELMKSLRVRLWFEELTNRLFALRNSPYSGFANQTHESVASLLSFGLQGMWMDFLRDARGEKIGLSYHSEHIGQIYVQENFAGVIDVLHRKFRLTHRQAIQQWGEKAPETARKGARDKRPDDTADYLHVLEPNAKYRPGAIGPEGFPVASCYVSLADRQVFDVGGFRTRRLIASRFEKSPTEEYGRCPAMSVLPAVKATQAMMRDLVTATEFAARPALLAHEDLQDQLVNYSPGGISYGGIDSRGNPMLRPMFENADIQAGAKLLEETRAVIRRAFYEDLYMIREEVKTHVSATEVMMRDQQKGILLAPLKRQENEWFTPMTEAELDLMDQMGMLDDMPPEVREAGGLFQCVYENPLNRARQAGEAAGFYNLLNGVAPLMQADPQAVAAALFQKFPLPRVIDGLAKIHGVPASWEASEADREAAEQKDAGSIEEATALELGDKAAGIVKNLSGALPAAGGGVAA